MASPASDSDAVAQNAQKCDDALRDPRSTEGKRLHRKISSMLSQSGKYIPWSLAERANTKGLMFAMRDRHGMPSLFITFAIDDTREHLQHKKYAQAVR
jgi:hypothetical protein